MAGELRIAGLLRMAGELRIAGLLRMPGALATSTSTPWSWSTGRPAIGTTDAPGALEAYPVSSLVSNVRNNGPELVEPVPAEGGTEAYEVGADGQDTLFGGDA